MNKCDVCGVKSDKVKAGRWIFYCPAHRFVDIDKTVTNEILPDLESGDMDMDGELAEIAMEIF